MREIIKKLSGDRHMTLKEIAERAGISKNTVEMVLNGRSKNPTLKTVARIADALGYDLTIKKREVTE
jgi:transcriptional regulator with XRE-family HTH domain